MDMQQTFLGWQNHGLEPSRALLNLVAGLLYRSLRQHPQACKSHNAELHVVRQRGGPSTSKSQMGYNSSTHCRDFRPPMAGLGSSCRIVPYGIASGKHLHTFTIIYHTFTFPTSSTCLVHPLCPMLYFMSEC